MSVSEDISSHWKLGYELEPKKEYQKEKSGFNLVKIFENSENNS